MIDINTEALPGRQANALDYLDAHFPGQTLHRYIQAHLELDHMRGLTALLARRRIKYAWFPLEGDAFPHHPDDGDGDAAEWASHDCVRQGKVADSQAAFPVVEQDRALLDRFDLEGWSVVMPNRGFVELCKAADGLAPPSFIVALAYAGVRVLLGGEVRQSLWRTAVRRPVVGYGARPCAPALDIMRPAQVVLPADSANRAETARRIGSAVRR